MNAPSPRLGPWSAYTVLGFFGYGVASALGAALAIVWDLSLGERIVGLIVPPLAFVVIVTIATVLKGREWIVFYQSAIGAIAAVAASGWAIGGDVARLLDLAALGIAAFLVFGRLGCFSVACCHGVPAAHGVVYRDAHVAAGLWRRSAHRPLVPVQLVEAIGALALVGAGLLVSSTPGAAALVVALGYAALRFALEVVRGDPARPMAYGLSEAQWASLAVAATCAIAQPSAAAIATVACLAAAAVWLVARHRHRELVLPQHVHELDRLCDRLRTDREPGSRATSLGVAVSLHVLPDGRADWVLSSQHPMWSAAIVRRIAASLWPGAEIVEGRTPGIVHVVV